MNLDYKSIVSPRVPLLAALLSLACAAWTPATEAAGQGSTADRFQRYESPNSFNPATKPLGLRGDERVKVVVTMSEDAVATVRANAVDHVIPDTMTNTIRQRVRAQHAAVEPEIAARGGKVLARFHDALNGMKIEINRDQIPALATMPGVVEVLPVGHYRLNTAVSVPFLNTPAVWQGNPGFRGEGIKIAVVDTGIDFTHANFGGPGTVAAFTAAAAASTQPADPALFGPNAPKVKGGTDLVGDDYNADPTSATFQPVPHPDPNPLDCNGHGSHVSGIATGFGVTGSGGTYSGPYNSAAYQQGFRIGPGVAPKADLYSVRVFGCVGSTDVVTEAIEWAVQNHMDVISMSLGSDFGTAKTSDAVAAQNAAKAGIIVVAASGNAGPAPYITSTPASGNGVISVAAIDSTATFPGAAVKLDTGKTIEAIDANGAPLPGNALGVVVLRTASGAISQGCNEAEYVDATIAGKLVVTVRGNCDRVFRAVAGQKHGAAAVAMINTSAGYPPFEGTITGDAGINLLVTIPFLGVLQSDTATLVAAANASLLANALGNPGFRTVASFSSGGPRFGDSQFKPSVAAPGVALFSTLSGSGNGGLRESGTSQATPHVAGVAALAIQAHPKWHERSLNAAVVQTADPGQLSDYAVRLEGAGLVQPVGATRTQAVVVPDDGDDARNGLSFGFEELLRDFHGSKELNILNHGTAPIVFNVTATPVGGAPHTISFSHTTVTVEGKDDASLRVRLAVPAASVGDASAYREVAGFVTLTPADSSMNGGVSLHVPYYLVPRVRSEVASFLERPFSSSRPDSNVRLVNFGGAISGNADFYAWGLRGQRQGIKFFDTRAVGVQSNPISATDSILVFAINTFERFSNAAGGEFDILIDVNGDGVPDFDLVGGDLGALTTGSFNGQVASALINLKTGRALIKFLADAPTDGSTVLLPVLASDLGVTPANPRFSYSEQTFNLLDGTSSALPGVASFNAFSPAISNALFVPVAPNSSTAVPVAIDPAEFAKTPALGLMVVTEDNHAGAKQARLIEVRSR